MNKLKSTNIINIKYIILYLGFVCSVLLASYLVSQIYTPHIALSLTFRIITWIIIPIMMIILLNKGISLKKRHSLLIYIIVLLSSGVIMGIYPNPKGIFTLLIFNSISQRQLNFLILPAVAVLTIVTIIGGKLICGWACPLGVFQDIIYTLHSKLSYSGNKIKVPFYITNSTRIIFLLIGLFIAIFYYDDIVTYDSPFGIFRPENLSLIAIIIILLMISTSPFIYRPWCTFLCVFGLVSWLYEKVAIFRIKVNKNKCSGCEKCIIACPTMKMKHLLQGKSRLLTPDCWTCGYCIQSCTNKAIHYTCRKF